MLRPVTGTNAALWVKPPTAQKAGIFAVGGLTHRALHRACCRAGVNRLYSKILLMLQMQDMTSQVESGADARQETRCEAGGGCEGLPANILAF